MNILIVGLGSIGQRHLRILKKNYKKKVSLYTLDSTKNKRIIKDDFRSFKVKSLTKYYGIKEIKLKDIAKYKISSAFICNPPNLHLKTAIDLANYDCNLFIEKPISTENELKGIQKLIKLSRKKKLIVRVGYQLRFHPGIKIIKELIDKNIYGKILNGYFHFGEFTGSVKKFEKFTDSIYINKHKGGGALLAFSHHLDLAYYFFGKLKTKFSILKNSKNFNINVEDTCKIVLSNKKKNYFLFNFNFLDNPQENFFILNFQKGSIKWNYTENYIQIKKYNNLKSKTFYYKGFKRNNLFSAQTKKFFSDIKSKSFKNETLHDSFQITKLINEIKKKNSK